MDVRSFGFLPIPEGWVKKGYKLKAKRATV
jgi:hypothetical protein